MNEIIFINNKYYKWYISIIEKAKLKNRKKYKGEYFESHHIIPKCLMGDDSKENKILLTTKEHFICHHLLIKFIVPVYEYKMLSALQRFTCNHKHLRSSNLYVKFIEKKSKMWSEKMTGEGNTFYGKQHTEETIKKLSAAKVGENHPFYRKNRPEYAEKMKLKCGKDYPKFAGTWITPWGNFDSFKDAKTECPIDIPLSALYNYCRNVNDKIILEKNYNLSSYLRKQDSSIIGKSYKDIGFGFIYV